MRMKDIAQELGVSRTTVSLTLSGKASSYGIPLATQQRIHTYVEAHGYVPNADAVNITLKTRRVGIIIPQDPGRVTDAQRVLFFELLDLLKDAGVQPIIHVMNQATCYEDFRYVLGHKVETLIVLGFMAVGHCLGSVEKLAPLLRSHHVIVVDDMFLPRNDENPFANAIRIGFDRKAAFLGVLDLLRALGHRRIAIPASIAYLIYDYSIDTGDVACLPIGEMTDASHAWFDVGTHMTDRVLSLIRNEGCTGTILRHEQMAIGLMGGLMNAGVAIPGDFSVAGFNNHQGVAQYAMVPLTTVDIPVPDMLRVLHEQLLHPSNDAVDLVVPVTISRRASVGDAPQCHSLQR